MEKLLAKMYEQSESKAEKKQYRVLNALKAAAFLNLAVFYFLYNINVAQVLILLGIMPGGSG